MQNPVSGPNFVAEYQVSGLPFAVSGSTNGKVSFPYVTQWIFLRSNSGTSTFGFTEAGLNSTNKFSVGTSATVGPLKVKLTELWVSGSSYEVVAGLTMVPPNKMWFYVHPPASGSVGGPLVDSDSFGYTGI